MKRRTVLWLSTVMLASPACVLAQTPKRFRVGWLWSASEANIKPIVQAFIAGLRELGLAIPQSILLRTDRVIE